MAIDKLKTYKSPDIEEISAYLIETGGQTVSSEILKLNNPIWNQGELPQ